MLSPHELARAFERNMMIVKMQADSLTHEESLLQPPFQGNCLNWVVGHLVQNRDEVLEALGEPPLSSAEMEPYRRESEPLTGDNPGVLRLEELIDRLERAQAKIAQALERHDDDSLTREITVFERQTTVARRLFFLYFHETYHVGQTELLRQLAGRNDKVI